MVIYKDSNDSDSDVYNSWVIKPENPNMGYEEICECVLDWLLLKRGITSKPAFLSFSINRHQVFGQTFILLINLMRNLETTNLFKGFKATPLGIKSNYYCSLKVDFSIRSDGNPELERLFDIANVYADINNIGVIYSNASNDELAAAMQFIDAVNTLSGKPNQSKHMAKLPYLHLTYNSANKERLDGSYAYSFKGGICMYGRKIIICANSNKYYALLEAMGDILDNDDVDMNLIESMENRLGLKVI